MFGWMRKKSTPTGPMWRHGQECADRDIDLYGPEHALIFSEYTLELDPSSWYAMSYRSRTNEGD